MATRELPSPGELHKYLAYDPATGALTWLARTPEMFEDGGHSKEHTCAKWNAKHAGTTAMSYVSIDGYRQGKIGGVIMSAHRVVWALCYGFWPSDQIDHMNGVRADNRIANLRDVTNAENGKNMGMSCRNTSGVNGVAFERQRGRWRAQIKVDGKSRTLGRFDTIEEAAAARQRANIKHGFSERHGTAA